VAAAQTEHKHANIIVGASRKNKKIARRLIVASVTLSKEEKKKQRETERNVASTRGTQKRKKENTYIKQQWDTKIEKRKQS
jgi:predicted TIM-barrel fold metal-dependent hydrolase